MARHKMEAEDRANLCDQRTERLRDDVINCVGDMKNLQSLVHMRDLETKRANEQSNELKLKFAKEVNRLELLINNVQSIIDT